MPPQSSPSVVVGVRLQPEIIDILKNVAIQNSMLSGKQVSHNDLIRDAINSVYSKWLVTQSDASFASEFEDTSFDIIQNLTRYLHMKCVTDTERDIVFMTALETDEGRIAFAQSFVMEAIDFIEKHSLARQILRTHELHRGELPRYPRNKDVSSFVLYTNDAGEVIPMTILDGEEVFVPTSITKKKITLSFQSIRNDPCAVITSNIMQNQKKAVLSILQEEEQGLLNTIQTISHNVDRYIIDDIQTYLKDDDIVVIPEKAVNKMLLIFGGNAIPLNAKASRKKNTRFKVVNHELDHVVVIPKNGGGVLAARSNLTVLPSDEPEELRLGWMLYCETGMMVTSENMKVFQL